MIIRKRGEHGQFIFKSDEYREIRSLRLTNKAWESLRIAAEIQSMTRADLIEKLAEYDQLSLGQQKLSLQQIENAITKIINDPQVTRNGKDRGSVKRALDALLKYLS